MDSTDDEVSPDRFRLTVDGFEFSVEYDESQPGAYHYTRLAGADGGPAVGYGFTSRSSDHRRRSTARHVDGIRAFLDMVDPATGYIEDDPED